MSESEQAATKSPSSAAIRAALERINNSDTFAQAGRSREFLRHVVDETLAGRADRLKGLAIAVDVFGRAPDFDAQNDPLVRVEASRLRRRLVEYYAKEGRTDDVRIELNRGSYVPRFVLQTADSVASGVSSDKPKSRRFLLPTIGVAALLIALVLALFWERYEPAPPSATVSTVETEQRAPIADPIDVAPPRLVVLPLADLSSDQTLDDFAAGLTEELNSALVAFDIVAIVSPNVESSAGLRLSELRDEYRAGYALLGSVRTSGTDLRVILRAMDTRIGTQFWTLSLDESLTSDTIGLQQQLALAIAQLIASPYGPVFMHEIGRIATIATEDLNTYQCLLRFYDYARTFDPSLHAESVRCMQRTIQIDPQFPDAWSALATLYLHEHTFGFTPQSDRGPPLDRALEAVRTSLDIDGAGRVAAITMAGIQRAIGDTGGFVRQIERAQAIEPPHPAVQAQVGYLLILAGRAIEGRALMDAAIPVTANVPGWYYIGHTLSALETGDYEGALTWALRIDAPTWFAAPLAVAASAALAGRLDLAQREVERLIELYPDFEQRGRLQLENWLENDALVEILLTGLERAGLVIA